MLRPWSWCLFLSFTGQAGLLIVCFEISFLKTWRSMLYKLSLHHQIQHFNLNMFWRASSIWSHQFYLLPSRCHKNIHYKRNSCNKKKKRRISNRFINGLKWNKWRCYLKIITLCTLGFLDILNDEFWIIIFFHSKWITLWKRTLQILTDRGFQRESAKFLCHEPTAVRSRAHVP